MTNMLTTWGFPPPEMLAHVLHEIPWEEVTGWNKIHCCRRVLGHSTARPKFGKSNILQKPASFTSQTVRVKWEKQAWRTKCLWKPLLVREYKEISDIVLPSQLCYRDVVLRYRTWPHTWTVAAWSSLTSSSSLYFLLIEDQSQTASSPQLNHTLIQSPLVIINLI